jgi:pyruvate dehydrogenase E1 component alpha subunit
MEPDLWILYRQMLRSRLFEEVVKLLWEEGQISGEMHMSIGEEGIVAGVVTQLRNGDAMALDHRGSSPMIIRGVDPVLLLRELLGRADGLCAGKGGHMHLFSREHLAASSGIIGASGPAGAGFALAAQRLRPGSVVIAFFGEGAMNQGMLLESMNLAAAWKLPMIFICKDNEWAISTVSSDVTGGSLDKRARSFGMPTVRVNGSEVEAVWLAAEKLIEDARVGRGPAFIYASCVRPDGHMLGDRLLRTARRDTIPDVGSLLRSAVGRGNSIRGRLKSISAINTMLIDAAEEHKIEENDPLLIARQKLAVNAPRLRSLETEVNGEMEHVIFQSFQAEQDEEGLQ